LNVVLERLELLFKIVARDLLLWLRHD
jgi:hypothetical protein